MTNIPKWLGRALRAHGLSEKGAATVEVTIVFPFFVGVFLGGYEVSMMNMRAVMVERATDLVVREIRLGGGVQVDHDLVRNAICANTVMIPDCLNVVKIELTSLDADTPVLLDEPDCEDRGEPGLSDPQNFSNGGQNELMLIRVCAVVEPMIPTFGVGRTIPKDDTGAFWILASSAFVIEPI